MKFLKTKNISKFSITDNTFIAYPAGGNGKYSRVVIDATGGLMLPKGSTEERPQLTGVRQPTDANGTIRYNSTIPCIEAYVGGAWVVVASPAASAIVRSEIGTGDGVETVFGPLNTSFVSSFSASDNNIIVLVENVFQIGEGENFDIVQSASGNLLGPSAPYDDGWYVKFTSAVPATGGGGNPVKVTVYYGYAN